jgi:NOL1/NOP2/fmu family ribosome biogenesis protein
VRRPSRRAVLRAVGLLGAVATTGGCGIRLESDAPDIPLLARQKAADEDVLVSLLRGVEAVARVATTPVRGVTDDATARWLATAAAATKTQGAALRSVLRSSHVPSDVVDPRPTTSATTATVTSRPAETQAVVRAALAEAQARLVEAHTAAVGAASVVTVSPPNRALGAAVLLFHGSSAHHLGTEVSWPIVALPPAAAATALDDMRAARYGLQVAAAHLERTDRAHATTTIAALTAQIDGLIELSGASARPAPAGYTLPFPVTDTDTARLLVRTVLGGLVDASLRPLADLGETSGAVPEIVHRAIAVVDLALGWGLALPALPGIAT